ncbi:MAG: two-component sensor histidine kinase [Natronohydrobacter sp.]|nr:two-component sensor histidine kinase [Natronohydrobacter sp.]
MMKRKLKTFFPASFYGRAVLILIMPIIVIQIVLSVVFIQRHYERVTTQLSTNTAAVLQVLIARLDASPAPDPVLADLADTIAALQIGLSLDATLPESVARRHALDLAGGEIVRTMQDRLPTLLAADLARDEGSVRLWLDTRHGVLELTLPRRLLTTSNPHQLLVIVFLASVLMTLIAFQFLRLQIRPIRRLGAAAEAYGRGERVALRASGAREVRAAAHAFIDMRNRLERQRAQQQIMLSGVSHDMRTPLTRMRLILSMMDDSEDRAALEIEILDLEARLERFLDYTRGQMTEHLEACDLDQVIADLVARYRSAGHQVSLSLPPPALPPVMVKAGSLGRALDNLISNALRHGSKAEVSRRLTPAGIELRVEDDGPGIAPEDRARACDPFVRLDEARNSDSGGMGLGLAIVADAARAHGGSFTLDESASLGGLCAILRLPLQQADQSR